MSRKGHLKKSSGRSGPACNVARWNGAAVYSVESFLALRAEDRCAKCQALVPTTPKNEVKS